MLQVRLARAVTSSEEETNRRSEFSMEFLRQGGTRNLAARSFVSIPFGSDACRTQVNVSSDELSTSLLEARAFVHCKMSCKFNLSYINKSV